MTTKRLQNKPQQATEPLKGMAVGRNWRVGADTLNIIVYRRQVNKKTGKEYWRAHSYYATVANALVGRVNQGVRDTEIADLKTVNKRIEEIHTWISKALGNTRIVTRSAKSLKETTRSRDKGEIIPGKEETKYSYFKLGG